MYTIIQSGTHKLRPTTAIEVAKATTAKNVVSYRIMLISLGLWIFFYSRLSTDVNMWLSRAVRQLAILLCDMKNLFVFAMDFIHCNTASRDIYIFAIFYFV